MDFKKKKDDWWEMRDAYQAEDDNRWDRKYGIWIAVFIVCAVCIFIMRYIEKTLYGGVIDTAWQGWRTAFIGIVLGFLISDGFRKEPKTFTWKSETGKKIAKAIFWLLCFPFLIWCFHLDEKPWIFSGQIVLGILLCFFFYRVEKRREKPLPIEPWLYALIFIMVIVPALVMPRVMGFITTKEAETIVTEAGYTKAEYLGWLYDTWVYDDAQTKPFPEPQEWEKQYYMVFGRKGGEPYRFIIDPEGGDIILAAAEKDEPLLGNWYR